MAQKILPDIKAELHDGNDWFALASENWVLNQIKYIAPVLTSTTANLTATYANGTSGVGATLTNSGTQAALVIDGVTLAVGNRVLIKNQTVGLQNGIYTVTNIGGTTTDWVLTRATDYDDIAQITKGDVVAVINGNTFSSSLWMLTSSVTAIGVDSFIFTKTDQNSFTSILGTTNQINVNVTGTVATVSIAPNPVIPGTESVTIPIGTTLQRPATPTIGMIRFNTDL